MQITAIKTRIFRERENLISFIRSYVPSLPDRSILVITSKIVALAEGRTVVAKNEKQRVALIKKESQWAMETKYTWLTIKDGAVLASAGIDESNGNGKFILLPKNSFKTASAIRKKLLKLYKMKNLGIVITDSRLLPLRAGVVGIALGYAGFKGIKDYRGKLDIFRRPFQFSKTDVADSLATAAVLPMGEGNERQPLAIIKNAPVEFTERVSPKELHINVAEDVYQPLFSNMRKYPKRLIK